MVSTETHRRLFCFGVGYTATRFAVSLAAEGWAVAGTCRSAEKAETLEARGIEPFVWDGGAPTADLLDEIAQSSHVLSSVSPDEEGDPVLRAFGAALGKAELDWVGYLSSTSVYGDAGGGRVTEATPPNPSGETGRRRLAAEEGWRALHRQHGVPVHVFRLAGIYGPGRSMIDRVRAGTARRIVKPGHVVARIHVDDIVEVLRASIARPRPGAVYNVADDLPAATEEVVSHASELLGVAPPAAEPLDQADLSPMARGFYENDRIIDNALIRSELGISLRYPDYRTGLAAILQGEQAQ